MKSTEGTTKLSVSERNIERWDAAATTKQIMVIIIITNYNKNVRNYS